MAGRCPKNLKSLKGGVTCKDAAGQTCFCSRYGCSCDKFAEPDAWASHDAQRLWCQKYDPGHGPNLARYNKYCEQFGSPLSKKPAIQEGAEQAGGTILGAANAAGFNWDNLMIVGLVGLAVLAVIVSI